MIALVAIFATFITIAVLGTIVFPKIYKRIWLHRLQDKHREIRAEIELMSASFDTRVLWHDFRRSNAALTARSRQRGADMNAIWNDFDNFQKSLALYSSDLLEGRVSRSIGDSNAINDWVNRVISALRERTSFILAVYTNEFKGESAELLNILAPPYSLYRQWVYNIATVNDLKKEGRRKSATDRSRHLEIMLTGLVQTAVTIRDSFFALQEVDEYIAAFYNGNEDSHRPVSEVSRDIAHEIILNAGWTWRMNDHQRASEMAHKAEAMCKDFSIKLQSTFGLLEN